MVIQIDNLIEIIFFLFSLLFCIFLVSFYVMEIRNEKRKGSLVVVTNSITCLFLKIFNWLVDKDFHFLFNPFKKELHIIKLEDNIDEQERIYKHFIVHNIQIEYYGIWKFSLLFIFRYSLIEAQANWWSEKPKVNKKEIKEELKEKLNKYKELNKVKKEK